MSRVSIGKLYRLQLKVVTSIMRIDQQSLRALHFLVFHLVKITSRFAMKFTFGHFHPKMIWMMSKENIVTNMKLSEKKTNCQVV